MYRPPYCYHNCYNTTVRRRRICQLPIYTGTHLRDYYTTIIHNNTTNRYINSSRRSIYIAPTVVLTTPYLKQSGHSRINLKPQQQYCDWRFIRNLFIGSNPHNCSHYYYESRSCSEFTTLQLNSRRNISDSSKATTVKKGSKVSKMNQTTSTPTTPTSSKVNINSTSVAKIDTDIEVAKEEDEEVCCCFRYVLLLIKNHRFCLTTLSIHLVSLFCF